MGSPHEKVYAAQTMARRANEACGEAEEENRRLRALLLCAASDLAWCTGFIEQAGSQVPQSVRRTIDRALAAGAHSDDQEGQ